MGISPTFNIEIEDATENVLDELLEQLSQHYKMEHFSDESYFNFDEFCLKILYTECHSEYLGNYGEGIIIQYSPDYSEDMETVFPILEEMKSLYSELTNMNLLSEYNIKYYTTAKTV